MSARQENPGTAACLEGWDPTPGIVSVWADGRGHALVWRRLSPASLVCDRERFRPWVLLDRLDDLAHLGPRLGREGTPGVRVTYRELRGSGALRYLVRADDARTLKTPILDGHAARLGRRVAALRELGKEHILALPLEEQYLVSSGRTYFRGLSFDDLHRQQ